MSGARPRWRGNAQYEAAIVQPRLTCVASSHADPTFRRVRQIARTAAAGAAGPDPYEVFEDWLLEPDHPIYRDCQVQFLTAFWGPQPCGRAAAIVNRLHDQVWGPGDAFVGFFESVDDLAVAELMLRAVREWCAERKVRRIFATVSPSSHYTVGQQTSGFEQPDVPLLDSNPAYYAALFRQNGYQSVMQWNACRLIPERAARGLPALRPYYERAIVRGIQFGTLRLGQRREWQEAARDVYNGCFADDWGFLPIPSDEFDSLIDRLGSCWVEPMSLQATLAGKIIGVTFAAAHAPPSSSRTHIAILALANDIKAVPLGTIVGGALAYRVISALVNGGHGDAEYHFNTDNQFTAHLMRLLHGETVRTLDLFCTTFDGL
jgi:hypothetical protein